MALLIQTGTVLKKTPKQIREKSEMLRKYSPKCFASAVNNIRRKLARRKKEKDSEHEHCKLMDVMNGFKKFVADIFAVLGLEPYESDDDKDIDFPDNKSVNEFVSNTGNVSKMRKDNPFVKKYPSNKRHVEEI